MRRATMLMLLCLMVPARAATIKAGSVLDIRVEAHPELSGRFTVSENGAIDYPLLADESVAGVVTSDLMNTLTLRLAKHIDNPLVTVSIVENPDIAVLVLGEVQNPGPIKSYQGVSMQEVIKLAGGPTKSADLERIKIVRKNAPAAAEQCNLAAFMASGDIGALPTFKDGDRVIVLTKKNSTKVKVIGAVQRPGFFELEEQVNIFEIVYMAGGPAERADLSRVRRFFQNNGKTMEEVVDLQSYIDKGTMDAIPKVAQGDVIIVYQKWFDWKTLLTILNNTLLFIVTIQAFSGVLK